MKVVLSKHSEVPLHRQLAEQIVFLITTGELQAGQQLPSVRALARSNSVHHNTVSEAYQDLVRRRWVTRQRGSRLIVGSAPPERSSPSTLDELINECIARAKQMGFSLQALSKRARERLLAQPPDHILIVEDEAGLREIIRCEVREKLDWPIECCTSRQFADEPGLAVGAQVFAPSHNVEVLKPLLPQHQPAVSITYSTAAEHLDLIHRLEDPSIIAVVSVSQSLLRTARGLLASAVERRHTYREFLLPQAGPLDLRGVDLAFCDSTVISSVKCRRKIRYHLVGAASLHDLTAIVEGAPEPASADVRVAPAKTTVRQTAQK